MRDWDDAYANMAHIEGSAELPAIWAKRAAAYRDAHTVDTDIAYGDAPREKFDIVWPEGTPKGLAVFVHGGYWMRCDRSDWTDLAEGARAKGWAVALPSYTLAPEARLTEMTAQVGAAITAAAARVKGPIRIAGHSAGGHLVSRMVSADSPLPSGVRARLEHTLSISGLHDLRPLMWTEMNKVLHLDEAEAISESAALKRPLSEAKVRAWVGGDERAEFLRQAQLLGMMWQGLEAEVDVVVDSGHHHFSVIEALADPESPLPRAVGG
jgi:hypothetical protein